MTDDVSKYLRDVIRVIDNIRTIYLVDVPTLEAFEANMQAQVMVERDLITLGEATSQLRKRKVMLSNADRIINRRNVLVHQYDRTTLS